MSNISRTDRQRIGIKKWANCGGHGVLEYATGVGKTTTSLMLIQSMYKRNPQFSVLIAVPTEVLKEQWNNALIKWKLFNICKVEIFNTIIRHSYDVDLFVVDEVHLSPSPSYILMYDCVKYRYLLGLTATWERLDGAQQRLLPYMQICDTITLTDALENGWVSQYRNYKVLIDVDLAEYDRINHKFQSIFSVFGHDFKLIMDLIQHPVKVAKWAKNRGLEVNVVRGYLATFMRLLKQRKSFVMSHPKKFELANKILDYRPNKKIIIFSATVKDAEQFKSRALILHSQKKKAENRAILDKFNKMDIGVIASPKSLNAGVDVKGLSVGIGITCDSSITTYTQKCGRICRLEENKIAEMFTLIIKGTIEENWYNNCNKGQSYIPITEDQLDLILKGQELSIRPRSSISDINHRY